MERIILLKFWRKVDRRTPDECWNWTGSLNNKGYGIFYGKGPRNELAHRFSFSLEKPIPQGMLICHKCDNPSCVNPNHLFLGTYKDNARDAFQKGRGRTPRVRGDRHWTRQHPERFHGELNNFSKLTEPQVLAIRQKRLTGVSFKTLAAEYSMDPSTISAICRGERWGHLFGLPGQPTLTELLSVPIDTKPTAKITPEIARSIKISLTNGETGRFLAKKYGVHFATVSDIKRGLTWGDI